MCIISDDRPELKNLKNIMRCEEGVVTKWYDIGLELLDSNTAALEIIKENNQNDPEKCCTGMFNKWLESKPDASWNQLIIALRKIELNTAASNIEKSKYMMYLCFF